MLYVNGRMNVTVIGGRNLLTYTKSERGEFIVERLKQSLIRDLLETTQELNRAHDVYRLYHLSKKLMDLTESYCNEALTLVEEVEGCDGRVLMQVMPDWEALTLVEEVEGTDIV